MDIYYKISTFYSITNVSFSLSYHYLEENIYLNRARPMLRTVNSLGVIKKYYANELIGAPSNRTQFNLQR